MRIIQLVNSDGYHSGLYIYEGYYSQAKLQEIFDDVFQEAMDEAEDSGFDDIHDIADHKLETFNVKRVLAEEITTDII